MRPCRPLSDAQRDLAAEHWAWAERYVAHLARTIGWRDPETCEGLLVECYVRAIAEYDPARSPSLKGHVCLTLKRRAIDYGPKARRRIQCVPLECEPWTTGDQDTVDVYEALRALRSDDRATLADALEGRTPTECARMHGVTPNAINARLSKARRRFARAMGVAS